MSHNKGSMTNSYEISPEQERQFYQRSSQHQGKQPSPGYGKDDLLRAHFRNLEVLERSKNPFKQFVLPAAYAPSVASLGALQKISFNDLRLETHHRGYFITAKVITPPYQSSSLITLIQDDAESVAKLILGFEDSEFSNSLSSDGQGLPVNSTVAIKEPYCKYNGDGDFVIRVDHFSDVAILRGDDPAVSMIMDFVSQKKEITPAEWKNAGDKSYLEKQYPSAIECYTQAIDNAPKNDPTFLRDVYRKRAFANLTARSFVPAKDDALASCAGDGQDEKAYYCAGRAAYELALYSESKTLLEKALKLSTKDIKSKKELIRATARIREETGVYDFDAMTKSVTAENVHLDHASYITNTEVRKTEKHGRGLFASKNLEAGELVLCEKAFCFPDLYTTPSSSDNLVMFNFNTNARTQRGSQSALFLQLIEKLYNNSNLTKKFFELDGGNYVRSEKEGEIVDGVPVVDTFLVEAIRLKNSFSSPRLSRNLLDNPNSSNEALSTGLWIHAAYMNHSCLPNTIHSFIGDMMIMRTSRPVKAGEELTHQYIKPAAYYPERHDSFVKTWEFECECSLCAAEKKSAMQEHEKRRKLHKKIENEILKVEHVFKGLGESVPMGAILGVEKMLKNLVELHEPSIYTKNTPRLLLIHPTLWLLETYESSKSWPKVTKYALDVLKSFGFGDVVKDGKLKLEGGMINTDVFNTVRHAAKGYKETGNQKLADDFEQEARKMFVVLTGSEAGIEDVFTKS